MKKVTNFLSIILLLGVTIACKKEADVDANVAAPTTCRVSQVNYENGARETYQYDANGFITQVQTDYTDQAGKKAFYGVKCTYTSGGLLDRATSFGSTPVQDTYEQYTYANGSLSKIEITDSGKLVYRYEVTTNANKQITGVKGVSFDKTNYPEYVGVFTYDAQGRCIKSESTNANGVFYRLEVGEFDPAVKTDYESFKGWPIVVINYWYNYGSFVPVDGYSARRKYTISYGYDDTGKYVGMPQKGTDYTVAYKTNSNGYVTEQTISDASVTPVKITSTTTYTYVNCK